MAEDTRKVVPIVVPTMGESVSEGVLSAWLQPDGSQVFEGQGILEFESDKATLEVSSPATGILHHSQTIGLALPVGSVVGTIEAGVISAPAEKPRASVAVIPPAPAIIPFLGERSEETKVLSPLRQQLAKKLVASKSAAAHLTTFNEVDMSAIKDARAKLGEEFEARHGVRLGYMGFFVRACSIALGEFREVNAYVTNTSVTYHNYVDISVAVSTERGLLTPVIRNAHTLSVAEIEHAIKDFATRARDKKILPDELNGGTFTISNGGVFGSLLSTPIPNPPQSAVLGLHTIQDRAVVRDGLIVARPMMYLALTYDHRLLDGKDAIGFLKRVKDMIEEPMRLLLGA